MCSRRLQNDVGAHTPIAGVRSSCNPCSPDGPGPAEFDASLTSFLLLPPMPQHENQHGEDSTNEGKDGEGEDESCMYVVFVFISRLYVFP